MTEPSKTPRTDAAAAEACETTVENTDFRGAIADAVSIVAYESRRIELELAEQIQCFSEGSSKWVSVGERLPEAKDEYLCRFVGATYGPYMSVQAFDGADFLDYGEPAKGITHWMPLPEAPK